MVLVIVFSFSFLFLFLMFLNLLTTEGGAGCSYLYAMQSCLYQEFDQLEEFALQHSGDLMRDCVRYLNRFGIFIHNEHSFVFGE